MILSLITISEILIYKSEAISNDSWGHETRNPYQILPFKFNTYHAIIKGHYFV